MESELAAGPQRLESLASYRNVFSVVLALTILLMAIAALSVVIALSLRAAGTSQTVIGLVGSAFAGGLLLGARLSPGEIMRVGHIRLFAFFAALGAITTLSLGLGVNAIGWGCVQFVLGMCCAGILTAGESWVADSSPSHQRGEILAFYHVVSKGGSALGPFLVAGAVSGLGGVMICAALFAACMLPITITNKQQPQLTTATPFGIGKILKYAPAAAISAFMAGAVNSAVAQLYPLFASSIDGATGPLFAAQFNAAILVGAMVGLWPAGALSDRIDRRLVIAGLGVLGAVAGAGVVLTGLAGNVPLLLLCAGIFGAGSLSHYAVAVAHAADKARPEQVTSMMAGILTIWGIGSVVGPLSAGLVMDTTLGAPGLFMAATVALGIMALAMFTRTVSQSPVPEDNKEPFGVAPATSFAIAEFDPRGFEEQLELFDGD